MKSMRILMISGAVAAGLLVLLVAAAELGWLRGPAERVISAQLGRPVVADVFKIHLLTRTPGVEVHGLQVANAPWATGGTGKATDNPSAMVKMGRLDVAIRVLPLLRGKVVLANLNVENGDIDLLREAVGRANWTFGEPKAEAAATPLQLPVIERLQVVSSTLRVRDAVSGIAFRGDFSSEEAENKARQPLSVDGKGTLNKQDFSLRLRGGGVAALAAGQNYPFTFDLRHGATRITARGQVANVTDFNDFTADMTLEGRNLADLYYLTGLALPSTRNYSLKGKLSRAGSVYRLAGLEGRLGGSDLGGNLTVETGGARPLLTADLRSRLLDPADAGVIFGGEAGGDLLLPDSPLDLTRLRSMDAKVQYRAAAINVDKLPLKEVSLTLTLDKGRLTLDPLAVTLPQGQAKGSLVIDGSKDVPRVGMDIRLRGELADFVAQAGQPGALEGPLLARVKLEGSGMSFHKAASVADGTAAVVLPKGEIRQAFAELLGVNAARGLGLLLSGSQTQTPLRCGIASFEAQKGVLTTRTLVFDTGVVLAKGHGRVTMGNEALDFTLKGEPKEPRLLRLMVPIHIHGTLRKPELGVDVVPLAAQGGVAAALGAVLTPLAAVLPFVDIGLADNADCAALVAEARKDAGTPAAPSR